MHSFDWIAIALFFLIMIIIGVWSYYKISDTKDFFVSGGKLPWWLSGISHHVSGYSGAVFVAYAAIAYTHGFTIYVWWALTITVAILAGSFLIAPRWSRLRSRLHIQSPTEYLKQRYSLPTQQLMAWCGVILKLFDVGAKWAAIAILLNVFTGIPILYGILLAGGISLIYITLGGLWAVVWTDFAQFVVQIIAGIVMFVVVLNIMDGAATVFTLWDQLPEDHSQPFNSPYTAGFAMAFLFINFLSYNGGQWNLATRYISSSSGSEARKAALLSAVLYLVWPLILFFPMWAAPILIPEMEDPTQSYALLTMELLPPGLVGLVIASMFANTMSMTSSDANTITAVITRDILPNLSRRFQNLKSERSLYIARVTTFTFTLLTVIIAIYADEFGGVLGLIVMWFAALLGPIAVPMILGLIPQFRYCGSKAAIISVLAGLVTFAIVRFHSYDFTVAGELGAPIAASFIIFSIIGLISYYRKDKVSKDVDDILESVKLDVIIPPLSDDSEKKVDDN
ncbi:sodium:solute symporter family protein [Natronogracilivirga saccharolytica]|uniref:Na+:solute symporter n=1 Tax=Natronogracilivirga saccharolytica TaxID=2812953 RepID=A0A8J7UUU2_9BACT|nr:sodium:solute symporter family protein [Natronogracilivirga saccharolytica]MBP3193971.1 Na+:solute symporter [Natronogracilivirga saccharolytica]